MITSKQNKRLEDRPLASKGLISYRYYGDYGFIMVGATDNESALQETNRSLSKGFAIIEKLQVWNNVRNEYVDVY